MVLRQEIRFWLIRIFYISFFFFIFHRFFFASSGMIEQVASYVMYPFLKVQTTVAKSIQHQTEYKKLVDELHQEIDVMIIQQELLKQRIAQLESQQIFTLQTRELIEFSERFDLGKMSLSRVLLQYSCPQEDVLFIDGGKNRNYQKDDIVIYKNALVGRIIEVYPWYSKVALITDQRCKVSCVIGADAHGISCGKNNTVLELNFIPHYKQVMVGDLAISSGHGLVFPQGFVVGVVESITTDLVSHYIKLQTYFDYSQIEYVHVITKNGIS
jgi:rod shape-determining protein MreC